MEENQDYAYLYEKVLKEAFNCFQDGDELRLASATIYQTDIPDIKEGKGFELRMGVCAALRKYQVDQIEGKFNDISDFVNFWSEINFWIEKVFTTKAIKEINRAIQLLENLQEEIKRAKVR